MNKKFKVACVQLNTKQSITRNLNHLIKYINKAIAKNSKLIITPETSNIISLQKRDLKKVVRKEKDDSFLESIKKISKKKRVWILIGSLVILDRKNNIRNRSYLINDMGKVAAYYDKIHMFDIKISDKEWYKESNTFLAGNKTKVVDTPWGKIGMSICYDIRFPNLYRELSQAGSAFISIPSAFTKFTGLRHWETLLRARAIENGVYIFAPAQCGKNSTTRSTYGHSLIIDPMGKIIASAESKPGVIYANIIKNNSIHAKKMIPSWNIKKSY
jgi:predicted amidohydrolase